MIHLIFYDDECPFCQRCVVYIKKIDKGAIFDYASLTSLTANKVLVGKKGFLKRLNTLILVENYQEAHPRFWIRSKGVFRILWLIGSWRKVVGILCFLPSFVIDPFYRLVARCRRQKKPQPNREEKNTYPFSGDLDSLLLNGNRSMC